MLRVGIVGIGNMGSAHAKCIYENKIRGMALCALCDCDAKRAEALKKEYPQIPVYLSAEEMAAKEKPDALIIATPHKFHADIAIRALSLGIHVLVEKPVDITVTKAQMLNEAAEKSGKVFAVMFNQRTNPLFAKARQIVQSGGLGELKRTNWTVTNWYRTQRYYDSGGWRATWSGEGGGVLMNQAPHNLDLWQWICGMPREVTAFTAPGKYHRIEVEDDATLFVKYGNGATGTFITSTGEYPGTNRLEIIGDKGKLIIENGVLKLWQLEISEKECRLGNIPRAKDIPVHTEEISQSEPEPGHMGILQNFADAILRGEYLIAPGREAIRELTLANAAYLSAWKGSVPVSLPFDCREYDRSLAEKMQASRKKPDTGARQAGEYLERWKVAW